MYVCICNAVTDKQIRHAVESGVRDLWQLQDELGVATQCGSCKQQAAAIIREPQQYQGTAQPVVYTPSAA